MDAKGALNAYESSIVALESRQDTICERKI
jgi:hypothetical protein